MWWVWLNSSIAHSHWYDSPMALRQLNVLCVNVCALRTDSSDWLRGVFWRKISIVSANASAKSGRGTEHQTFLLLKGACQIPMKAQAFQEKKKKSIVLVFTLYSSDSLNMKGITGELACASLSLLLFSAFFNHMEPCCFQLVLSWYKGLPHASSPTTEHYGWYHTFLSLQTSRVAIMKLLRCDHPQNIGYTWTQTKPG